MKTTRPMPGFNGVAASATATLTCPIGLTFNSMLFTLGGTFVLADITAMRIVINGKQIYTIDGADLNVTNQFEGLSVYGADRLLHLSFDRPLLKTRANTELTAIGTGAPYQPDPKAPFYNPTPATTFQVEIDIGAGAVAPTLSAKAYQSGASPMGSMIKRRKFNFSVAGAGDFEISDLPRGDLINKIWIKHTGNVTRTKLERNNFLSFDRTPAENTKIQTDGAIRVPQANWFVIDPSEQGNGSEALVSAVQDFRLTLTTSAADTLVIYVDYIGGLGGQ